MLKAKFVHTKLPLSLKELSSLMIENQFSDDTGKGFILSSSAAERLSGQYIEKINELLILTDPFGNTTEVESVSYYACKYSWVNDSSFLTLIEPPRSLKKFANALHDLTGLGLVLSETNLELKSWLQRIEERVDQLTITKVAVSGIKASDFSLAKLSIMGSKDVRESMSKMLNDRFHILDSVVFTAEFDGLDFRCELSKTGSFKVFSINTQRVISILKESLDSSSSYH